MARPGLRRAHSLLQIAVVGALAFATRASFADQYFVPSGSMEPTVEVGDHIFVVKGAYGLRVPLTDQWLFRFAEPSRGQVVVLRADKPDVLVKRVVAVGGDTVEVRGGRVLMDGKVTREPTISLGSSGGPDFGPVQVPPGKVLVLGDNRGDSRDGRTFGLVDRDRVLGRAVAVVFRHGWLAWKPL